MQPFESVRLLTLLMAASCLAMIPGCGGGEDFSTPPPGLAAQREKSRDKKPPEPKTAAPPAQADQGEPAQTTLQKIAAAGNGNGAAADADQASPEVNDPVPEPQAGGTADPDGTSEPGRVADAEPATPAMAESTTKPTTTAPLTGQPAAPADTAVAGTAPTEPAAKPADSAAAVAATGDKPEPPATPAANKPGKEKGGLSFLDTLKSDQAKGGTRPGRVTASTGRLAVDARAWQQLKLMVSRRFFVAATNDATRLAGSTGERQLTVLSTRVEQRQLNADPAVAARIAQLRSAQLRSGPARGEDERTIAALPAVINSLELLGNGDLVLIGTEDGRLIARSAADLLNWDVYARDLFSFQDEFRTATRVSDSGIVAVRQLSPEHVLTVDGKNVLSIWKTDTVVHEPQSPLDMSVTEVGQVSQSLVTAKPVASRQLADAQLFSIVVSASGTLLGVVTADEVLMVLDPVDGRLIASFSADDLDDTQPVTAAFDEGKRQVYVGLADGRVVRRGLPGGTAVVSTTDDGVEVDYEFVFVPQKNSRAGAVTTMAMTADGAMLYFGRFDGSVSKYDVPRRQLVGTRKLHSRPVIDIRLTDNGVLSLDDGRVAQLTDVPVNTRAAAGQRQAATVPSKRFTIPQDPSLPTQAPREDEPTVQTTRPRNPNARQPVQQPATAAELGIRPADPKLALLNHQLRVAPPARADEIRGSILELQQAPAAASEAADKESPRRLGEISTQIEFGARVSKPVVMTVSNDGKLVTYVGQSEVGAPAASSSNQNAVIAVDVPTGTTLRSWDGLTSVPDGLDASWQDSVVLPRPLQSRLHLLTGARRTEADLLPLGQFAWSYDRRNIIAARTGISGQAMDTFTLQTPDGRVLKSGVESFEGAVGAMAYAADGGTIFVSIREKARLRLLELDASTLEIVNDLASEPMTGAWNVERVAATTAVGPVQILPSPGGRLLVTYGRHEKKYHLRFWKKSGSRWPQEQVTVIDSSNQMLATNTDRPFAFVNQKDNLLAVIGAEGIGTIDTRTGDVKDRLPVPDVNGRRPVILFTRDGRFALTGDGEGNIWVAELRSLDRRPKKFVAQAGEITGMVLSADGTKLATAGRENRIRVWDLEAWLYGDQKTAAR